MTRRATLCPECYRTSLGRQRNLRVNIFHAQTELGQLAICQSEKMLSLNDTPGVRETFTTFAMEEVRTQYTCSNGKNMKAGELLIRNYDLEKSEGEIP